MVSELCLLHPLLLIISVAVCRIECILSLSLFCLSFQARISRRLLLNSISSTESQLSHMGSSSTSSLPAIILPPSHPVWPSRFTSGHLLQRTQGDTCLLRQRRVAVSHDSQLAPSLSPATTALGYMNCGCNHPPHPLPPRGFCCFSATLIYGSAGRAAGTAG